MNPSISDIKALAGDYQRKTSEYDAKGRVTKRDGATLYVKLDGSDIETPVDATTAEAAIGDTVSVHVSHNDTHITGNRTNPAATVYTVVKAKSDLEDSIRVQDSRIEAVGSDVRIVNSAFQITDGVVTGLKGAVLDQLDAKFIDTEWVHADFSTVSIEKVRQLFATSGIINNLVVDEEHLVGELNGVTINGDSINANSIKANSLLLQGDDGVYYSLNVNALGETEAHEYPDQEALRNGIHGSNIIAETIDAEAINVKDLVAFGALIGGLKIDDDGIRSIDGAIEINADGTWHFAGGGSIGETRKRGGFYIAFSVDGKDGIYFMRENGDDDEALASFEVINDEALLRTTNAEMLPPDYTEWTDAVESDHVDIGNIRFRNRATGNLSIFPRR